MTLLFEIKDAIDAEEFSRTITPNARKVMEILGKYGFGFRIVGGAVRDFLVGKIPRDIDFATDADPAEIIFVLDLEGIDHDAGGIGHGTIKAVFDDEKVDITSISHRISVGNDSHVRSERHRTWQDDAARRDLTINSMSADIDGTLYDYTNGVDDLKNQTIRFNPGAAEKIEQDPFTMLRWFKAIALFDDPKWLKSDKRLISSKASLVAKARDDDRTKALLASLVTNPRWNLVNRLMCQTGVAKHLRVNCGD